jgi:hypothetical protein
MVSEKQQKSVDRARAQSHLILRRSLDELRRLKKGRTIQEQLADQNPTPKPTPASDTVPAGMDALMALSESQLAQRFRDSGMSSFCNPATTQPPVSKNIPRNAPCRSGAKYKKCCGGPAAQALNQAA